MTAKQLLRRPMRWILPSGAASLTGHSLPLSLSIIYRLLYGL
jgi:hypothetical protein